MVEFVAIDVETANEDLASICQIGAAKFVDGSIIESWSTLVDPEDYFSPFNVSIHRIEPNMVIGKPAFPAIAEHLRNLVAGQVRICHTRFDRVALECVAIKYGVRPIATTWMDSACIARRTWKECAWSGYGLAAVCQRIGYKFKHHDALEDAKACGFVLLAAIRESGLSLEEWSARLRQPIDLPMSSSASRDGNPDGTLFGEVLVFTGALTIPRRVAADMAASVGCKVCETVTKKTSILVVGDQDLSKLAGNEKSSKHRKAEQLIADGAHIRVVREAVHAT